MAAEFILRHWREGGNDTWLGAVWVIYPASKASFLSLSGVRLRLDDR